MDIDLSKLKGKYIYLELLQSKDKETLKDLAKDERIWEGNRGFILNETFDDQFDNYFATALDNNAMGGQQAFVMHKVSDDSIIGMTRFLNIDKKEKRLEIGYTWYIPVVWGKVYNKECKLLLLQLIFEQLKFMRAELRVAHQNIRSQKAVEKIGGVKEGVLRKHGYRNDGSIRHDVIYSIIDDEWTSVKENLLHLIADN